VIGRPVVRVRPGADVDVDEVLERLVGSDVPGTDRRVFVIAECDLGQQLAQVGLDLEELTVASPVRGLYGRYA
jgi:hypothetical protein